MLQLRLIDRAERCGQYEATVLVGRNGPPEMKRYAGHCKSLPSFVNANPDEINPSIEHFACCAGRLRGVHAANVNLRDSRRECARSGAECPRLVSDGHAIVTHQLGPDGKAPKVYAFTVAFHVIIQTKPLCVFIDRSCYGRHRHRSALVDKRTSKSAQEPSLRIQHFKRGSSTYTQSSNHLRRRQPRGWRSSS
jgi:hypothetical protein